MTTAPDPTPATLRSRSIRLFAPILAGATLKERLLGCLGALLGIGLTGLICGRFLGIDPHWPLIVAPMGATAVLLFAVPASPLAQPWPIIGGNTLSALIGIGVAQAVPDPVLATGLAVSLAILAMSFTRSLHPPGGATALTAVIGGPGVAAAGFQFALVPVAINSVLIVLLGIAFHRLARRSYPHRAPAQPINTHQTRDAPAPLRAGFQAADVDAALLALHETFDIDRDDLDRLLREVEQQALLRAHGNLRCRDIMSRDVVGVAPEAHPDSARALLLDHNIRTLPVRDEAGKLLGVVGLRELTQATTEVAAAMTPAETAGPDQLAMSLIGALTDGRTHAVMIVDEEQRVLGLITQTDLLAALARALPAQMDFSI